MSFNHRQRIQAKRRRKKKAIGLRRDVVWTEVLPGCFVMDYEPDTLDITGILSD